jgi:hypothetical protein
MKIINKEPEARLIELIGAIQEQREGWYGVCFTFSQLLEHYRSDYQIKIAINLMNDLLGDRDGAIFLYDDATIYVVVRNLPKPALEKMIFQLRYLFMDDPHAYTLEGDENPDFSEVYSVDTQWEEFNKAARRRWAQKVRTAQGNSQPLADAPPPQAKREVRRFDASSLLAVERELKEVDLRGALRRQPVCAAVPGMPIRMVFDEMYINIAALRQMLKVDVDMLSNRWLFKYLTQTLDMRMLDLIRQNTATYLLAPLSLNLNIPTLLSEQFLAFDAVIKPAMKVSIVIELQIADVFADMSAYLTARDVVQKLGYRICLDGVTDLSFPQIDRQRLGFDLIKVQWNAETEIRSDHTKRVKDAVRNCGTNRVIMTRCDNELAVHYGQSMGLSLFQGRYLDGQVNPKATLQN